MNVLPTSAKRLRALLDERGVKYGGDRSVIYFEDSRGYKAMAYEAPRRYGDGVLCVHHTATPEQAVEATLGRGTCQMEYVADWMGWHCKSCDNIRQGLRDQKPNFCPNCGRKVQ